MPNKKEVKRKNPSKKYEIFDSDEFNEIYAYDGPLGAKYSAEKTVFAVWSPTASEITLNIYAGGDPSEDTVKLYDVPMKRGTKGEWTAEIEADLDGKYYTYSVTNGGVTKEVVDPYAAGAGRNGLRGMIVNFESVEATPDGYAEQNRPEGAGICGSVIYEAHLRDLTISPTSGVSEKNRGKFLGLTERGTTVNGQGGAPTALDYIRSLGVTDVHFQPLFDFKTVNENFSEATFQSEFGKDAISPQYNWGYDPLNYNVPEGSYSSDPSDGYVRIREMRAMIAALHNAGIRVIMDVVYNHVESAENSNFEALVPGYYFRTDERGAFTDGSGCGNETASERYMFRRFMVDSVLHWSKNYGVDGFRFDLMGLHDCETMNLIAKELKKIDPDAIIYGEGWTGGMSGMDERHRPATLINAMYTPDIAYFNDIVRDGLKGSAFEEVSTGKPSGKGFVQGAGDAAAVYAGAAGGTAVKGVGYEKIGKVPFAVTPSQNINYVSAHDNSTLWDKLNCSVDERTDEEDIKAMARMAAVSVFTSQGAGFFLAGEEMLRSKPTSPENDYNNRPYSWNTDKSYYFADNSYRSPDSVNAIDWTLAEKNADTVEFYRQLIAIKKTFPQFSINNKPDLDKCLEILLASQGVAVYSVKNPNGVDYAVVIINAGDKAKIVSVPSGRYSIYINGDRADAVEPIAEFRGSTFTVAPRSAVVMVGIAD